MVDKTISGAMTIPSFPLEVNAHLHLQQCTLIIGQGQTVPKAFLNHCLEDLRLTENLRQNSCASRLQAGDGIVFACFFI